MKTIPVSLIVAAILAPAMVLAQPGNESKNPEKNHKDGKRGVDRPRPDFWKSVDKNQDGSISKEEFELMPRVQNLPEEKRGNLFTRLDKDADGKLAREEIRAMGPPRDGKGPPMQRLWELDVDKSGGISFEEFKAGRVFQKLPPEKQNQVFAKLDTDKDGLVTPKDKPEKFKRPGDGRPKHPDNKPGGQRPELRQMIRQLDKDGDGALSFEEFRSGPAEKHLTEDQQEDHFEAMDKNHDLKLSAEDFGTPPPRGEAKPPTSPENMDGPPTAE